MMKLKLRKVVHFLAAAISSCCDFLSGSQKRKSGAYRAVPVPEIPFDTLGAGSRAKHAITGQETPS